MKITFVFMAMITAFAAGQKCGRRSNLPQPSAFDQDYNYIVGGQEAIPHEFPWQVSFQIFNNKSWWQPNKWTHNCGGSIIDDRWILTAAHCYTSDGLYRIIVGAHNLTKREPTIQIFRIEKAVHHPGWDKHLMKDDIMLIKVDRSITLDGDTAAPICLPTSADENAFKNSICVSTGWGRISPRGSLSDVLLKADQPIVSNAICAMQYRNIHRVRITDSKICAGYVESPGPGTCYGDSGGPLACLSNGEYKLVGVTSFGVLCGSINHPAVFTLVSHYVPWINNVRAKY
ncbi:chymotrypsin-like elastase family member 2A [Varroa jacobsoni]|uniref:chymotrypsin-like elastase family member 2A n=1 Tax=Varroa jacobsoni TaxID=62625 RepID=UPI000BF534B9|nr:chymotrypsin-like elastase family member 2A [Varroa jacobsoni]